MRTTEYGPGDSATWLPCSGAFNDPRTPEPSREEADRQFLLDEIHRTYLQMTEAHEDGDGCAFGLGVAYIHDLTAEIKQ